MDALTLCERLFDAFASADANAVRRLCHEDLVAVQNNDGPMSLDMLIRFAEAVHDLVPDFEYANPRRSVTETGFVEEHDVQGTLPNGDRINLAVCIVAEISDGRIIALREYFDPSRARNLTKALQSARSRPGVLLNPAKPA
ncbi:MAG: nuclear transport factor 2 family protein [Pseudomonadota bacterium]